MSEGERREALVRTVIEAMNRWDLDSVRASVAPDFTYDLTRTASPLAGRYSIDEIVPLLEEFLGDWDGFRYELNEFIEAEDGLVTPFTTRFKGRDGIELEASATWLWKITDGKVSTLTLFQSPEDALAAGSAGG